MVDGTWDGTKVPMANFQQLKLTNVHVEHIFMPNLKDFHYSCEVKPAERLDFKQPPQHTSYPNDPGVNRHVIASPEEELPAQRKPL